MKQIAETLAIIATGMAVLALIVGLMMYHSVL